MHVEIETTSNRFFLFSVSVFFQKTASRGDAVFLVSVFCFFFFCCVVSLFSFLRFKAELDTTDSRQQQQVALCTAAVTRTVYSEYIFLVFMFLLSRRRKTEQKQNETEKELGEREEFTFFLYSIVFFHFLTNIQYRYIQQ